MDTLRIYFLGPFEVYIKGKPLAGQRWRSQQARAILKILVLHHGRVISTDRLIGFLWPDEIPEVARSRLHVRISQLRRVLDADDAGSYIRTVEGGYTFKPKADWWLDIQEFESLALAGRHSQELGDLKKAITIYEDAYALYRGDLLEEDLYDDWIFIERERLRERFLTLLTELAECYAQEGRYRRAISCCHQIQAIDPCREITYIRLMLYHYYAGERPQALRIYQQCRQILADELDVEPLPSTNTLAEQIRCGTLWAIEDAPRYPPPLYEGRLFEVPYSLSNAPFVGREREYAWLVEQWKDAYKRVILLAGEAGIGKSRLVEEFLGYVSSQGTTILRSRMGLEDQMPYTPITSALLPLLQHSQIDKLSPQTLGVLQTLFPELRSRFVELPTPKKLPPEQEKLRLFDALVTLLDLCAPDEILLVVDDAHRTSIALCELLANLAKTLKLVLVYRSEEVPSEHPLYTAFHHLRRQDRVAMLTLERLVPVAVQQLIKQLAHTDMPRVVEQVITQTDGNPLFVVALLQHMFEEGALYIDAGGYWADVGDLSLTLPPTMRKTIEARLRRLKRDQRRTFDIAAVLGGEFDYVLLQQISQQLDEHILEILDGLMDAGLIIEPRMSGRSEFAISHDCYTEIAYDTLPGVRCRHLHRRAAKAIEQVYADRLPTHFPALVNHYAKAGEIDSECRYAGLAGEQAANQFANTEAITYLDRAIELTPETDGTREAHYKLLLIREQVHDLLGDRQAQNQDLIALGAIAEHLNDRQRAEVSLRHATYAWATSDFPKACAVATETIHLAQKIGAVEIEAASHLLIGRATENQDVAQPHIENALALAKDADEFWLEGEILRCLGNACYWQRNYEASQTHFEQALSIHRQVGDQRGEISALNNLGVLAQFKGDFNGASQSYEQALNLCQKIGDRLAEGVLTTNLGGLAVNLGDFEKGRSWYEQAFAIRQAIGDHEGVYMLFQSLGEWERLHGNFSTAKAYYQRAFQMAQQVGIRAHEGSALERLGVLQRDLGDYAGARDYFKQALQILHEIDIQSTIPVRANFSLLFHLLGDDQSALEYSQQALALAESHEDIVCQAIALTNLAQAHAGLGQTTEAFEAFQKARDLRCKLGQPHLAIESVAGLADLALQQKNTDQAAKHVEEILDYLETGTLIGTEQPFLIYLTCYQVLQAKQDARAQGILKAAHDLLKARAATIEKDKVRCSFLENVIAHHAIMQAYQARAG